MRLGELPVNVVAGSALISDLIPGWQGRGVTQGAHMGTLQFIPGKGFVTHGEWAEWYEAWKESGDPYPKSDSDAWWGGAA